MVNDPIRIESEQVTAQISAVEALRTIKLDAEFQDALARFLIGHIDWEHAPGRGDIGRSVSEPPGHPAGRSGAFQDESA
jgi:hypothetical protein